MELLPPELLLEYNTRLKDHYGSIDGHQGFRLVYVTKDYKERRYVTHTDAGIELPFKLLKETRKYPHINERYVLERLTVIPEFVETDLVDKLSYEPIWTYEVNRINGSIKEIVGVAPNYGALKFVVEKVLEAVRLGGYYVNTEAKDEQLLKEEAEELANIEDYLFGDETPIGDALSTRSGVAYGPGSNPNSSVRTQKEG